MMEIFIYSQNSSSGRFAILDDNGRVAYLYLTNTDSQKPFRDAIAYSRIPLETREAWLKGVKKDEAPQLFTEIASETAIIASPNENEFSFIWSSDGHTAALLRNGEPIALVSAHETPGYSKAACKTSALATPWNQEIFRSYIKQKP